jgi:hypothetical protein
MEIDYEVSEGVVEINVTELGGLIGVLYESDDHVCTPYWKKALADAEDVIEQNVFSDLAAKFNAVTIEAEQAGARLTLDWKIDTQNTSVRAYLTESYYYNSDSIEISIEVPYGEGIGSEIDDWVEDNVLEYLKDCIADALNAAFESLSDDSIVAWVEDAEERVEIVTRQCARLNVAYVPTVAELDDIEQLGCFSDGDWVTTDSTYSIDAKCDRMLDRLEWAVENTSMVYASGDGKIVDKTLAVATTEEEQKQGNGYVYFELAAALEADIYSRAA